MKTGEIVFTLRADTRRLRKAMARFKGEVTSQKRLIPVPLPSQAAANQCTARGEGVVCRYCEIRRRLSPSAKACPECGHLMAGDTCDACYGQGASMAARLKAEISPKRLLEQQQQEQVDDDYERMEEGRADIWRFIMIQKAYWRRYGPRFGFPDGIVEQGNGSAANATNPTGGGDYFT